MRRDLATSAASPLPDGHLIAQALRAFKRRAQSLHLVVDDGPSMQVWRPTIDAFQHLVERCGAFRRVDQHILQSAGDLQEALRHSARQAVLVITDGLGEHWLDANNTAMLRSWGRRAPVAVINPFPQERWYKGHPQPRHVQLLAPRRMSSNIRLRMREPRQWRSSFDEPLVRPATMVPLLELSPRWLRWWAELLTRRHACWLDATVFIPGASRAPDPGLIDLDLPAQAAELVEYFRTEASAPAFKLATYIAAAPLELACLRVIQTAMLPTSLPVHLAEVTTSPLVTAVDEVRDGPVAAELEFRPGIREALLASAARSDTARVIRLVSDFYSLGFPPARALARALESPDEVPDTPVTGRTLTFALVELAVLRALSGPYALRARRLDSSIASTNPTAATANPGGSATTFEMADAADSGSPARSITPFPTAVEDGGTMSTPSASTPPPHPSAFQALTDPTSSRSTPAVSVDGILSDEDPAPRAQVWGNVPPRNLVFTGREDMLTELESRLRTERVTAVLPQALHGMGGVGKSQIAAEFAYRHRAEYDIVWWIPAEQPAQILRAIIALGERLDLDIGPEANTAVPAVQDSLRRGVPYSNWLLIFDNAETLETVRPYFPESGAGKVLVTSRNQEWSSVAESLEVDLFSREESVQLLQKQNPDITITEADQLAEALGDLPLAVGQASAWRATTNMPVAEYLRLLAEKKAELVDLAAAPGYEMPVAAAWNVALDRLGVESQAALQLLQVCSFFAPEPIARDLFTGPRNSPISPELDVTLQNPSKLNRAIRDIQKYGLARIDYRDQTIQLHRLVKTVLERRLSEHQRAEMEHGAHVLLAGGNPGNPDGTSQWPRYHALLPHVVASNAVGCADAWARELVLDVIRFYYYWGDHASCRDLAVQVVDTWREQIGPDDPQTLKAAKWLGYVQRLLGQFGKAAEINMDSLERLREIAGPDDEETLDAMSLVAADKRAAGDFGGARDLDREAFDACLQAFGEDDPTTLTAAHSLGVSLRLTGQFRDALELDADTCRRRAAILGTDHPLTLWTLNGLTLDLRECGSYLQAHREQEKLYERFLRFGQDHPNTLSAARNLAVSRRRAGEHEQARKLAEDTMNRLRQHFGALHPDTIAAALNYAVDLREADELDESRELAGHTYQEYETTLGTDHPYTLYARTNLGIVLRLLGHADEALSHDSAAFERLAQRLGRDHVLTLTCSTNLASDLAALGEFEQARQLDTDTLRRSRQALGDQHPSTLACNLNLSFDLTSLGQAAEGQRLFDAALASYRRALGEHHPAIVAALALVRANCDVDPMPL
jgi:tetratricopeptide (TPR) repeat protein